MNNFNVQTLRYDKNTSNLYPTDHKAYKNIELNDLINKLKTQLTKEKYFAIYHYYDGQYWFVESTNKNNNEKIFKIEVDKDE